MTSETREDLKIGPLEFVAIRSELEPAVRPRIDLVIKQQYEGHDAVDPISMSSDQWDELKEISDLLQNVVNFVPFTMLLTQLLDGGFVSPSALKSIAKGIEPGTFHFRPTYPSTKAIARGVVGRLLALEDE